MAYRNVIKTKYFTKRNFTKVAGNSGYDIRRRFLEFFIKENAHTFISSSPVVPLHDRSLAFVNAGMNQFKEVLLGNVPAPSARAANSQKCIRVGGKHNDLNSVGMDSYHHTFFEMLGNWSFGDYFKHEACELAWLLLTSSPYSIDPQRLYVTYFGGSAKHGLPPDLETKEIWRSLGVKPEHILPFGLEHNMWEMGRTGPCGVCTEIHVDHEGGRDASSRVNQGFSDVTELWNIVFIQYNRDANGTLSSLSCHHVDTGMGFERLVALLQNKKSNYDTDLFTPLFETISKVSKLTPYRGKFGLQDVDGLDTAYRILADHSRMATVAVADNMFPDHNHKLRRVIRKALSVAEDSFKMKNAARLMKEVCNSVAETLSSTYPEVGNNLNKVQLILDYEWEVMQSVREATDSVWGKLVQQDPRLVPLMPPACGAAGLATAYQELCNISAVDGQLAFRLYDTHGLPVDLIEDLCQALGLEFPEQDFVSKLTEAKERSAMAIEPSRGEEALPQQCVEELRRTIPVTDDSLKYKYTQSVNNEGKVSYVYPEVLGVVQAVAMGGELVKEVQTGERMGVVLNRTCFYCEAGGQQADRGWVEGDGWLLRCDSVYRCGEYVVHSGVLKSTSSEKTVMVHAGQAVRVRLDEKRRLANMRHHTATHCLNAVLQQMFVTAHQKGSSVTENYLVFDFATYGQHISKEHIREVEERVRQVVEWGLPVTRTTVSSSQLHTMMDKVTLLPGETYPIQGIHVITIQNDDWRSQEVCCGTHVLNTADLQDFCVCQLHSPRTGVKSLVAVAGAAAQKARLDGQTALNDVTSLQQQLQSVQLDNTELSEMEISLQTMKKQVSKLLIPFDILSEVLSLLEDMEKQLKGKARGLLRQTVDEEMQAVLAHVTADTNCRYLVHCLQASSQLDKVPLQKVTKMCPIHLPVLIFAYAEGLFKARCVVPQIKVSDKVTAQQWLEPVLNEIGAIGGPPRGQDPRLVYNMKPLRVRTYDVDKIVLQAVSKANQVAIKLFYE